MSILVLKSKSLEKSPNLSIYIYNNRVLIVRIIAAALSTAAYTCVVFQNQFSLYLKISVIKIFQILIYKSKSLNDLYCIQHSKIKRYDFDL